MMMVGDDLLVFTSATCCLPISTAPFISVYLCSLCPSLTTLLDFPRYKSDETAADRPCMSVEWRVRRLVVGAHD